MKKSIIIFVTIILMLTFVSCSPKEDAPEISIGTLAGPTGMGMVHILEDATNKYKVSIYTSPDQIIPKIINGEVDICAVPSNLASVLYAKTNGQIAVLSINTTGVLYIVENGDTINDINDLKGKTINASGQGASPEYILNNVLEKNGLIPNEDVTIIYHAEHATLANLIAAGEIDIAILPEPFVSVVTSKNESLNVQVDFNDLWHELYGENTDMPMGVTIVQKDFLEKYPKTVESFLKDYEKSIEFVNSNIDEAAELIAKHKIVGSPGIAKSAIPRSGISYTVGDELKSTLDQYLEVLFGYNPASVGGALPDEEFYYNK
ncbi:MAG: ABC transporter substrate-binding protein [Clostridiales bacterium]|nr:ABC transporter substrate-binding protein [Clostridiales bacterium]